MVESGSKSTTYCKPSSNQETLVGTLHELVIKFHFMCAVLQFGGLFVTAAICQPANRAKTKVLSVLELHRADCISQCKSFKRSLGDITREYFSVEWRKVINWGDNKSIKVERSTALYTLLSQGKVAI